MVRAVWTRRLSAVFVFGWNSPYRGRCVAFQLTVLASASEKIKVTALTSNTIVRVPVTGRSRPALCLLIAHSVTRSLEEGGGVKETMYVDLRTGMQKMTWDDGRSNTHILKHNARAHRARCGFVV